MTHVVNKFGEDLDKLHASVPILILFFQVVFTMYKSVVIKHVPRMLTIRRMPHKERQ